VEHQLRHRHQQQHRHPHTAAAAWVEHQLRHPHQRQHQQVVWAVVVWVAAAVAVVVEAVAAVCNPVSRDFHRDTATPKAKRCMLQYVANVALS
jgi:hypothetical protein